MIPLHPSQPKYCVGHVPIFHRVIEWGIVLISLIVIGWNTVLISPIVIGWDKPRFPYSDWVGHVPISPIFPSILIEAHALPKYTRHSEPLRRNIISTLRWSNGLYGVSMATRRSPLRWKSLSIGKPRKRTRTYTDRKRLTRRHT